MLDDSRTPFASAVWERLLGSEKVRTGSMIGPEWRRATFPWAAQPLAVLSPSSAEEAVACLRLAHETETPLYPVSGGRSWGLGSRLPPRDAAILDLSTLDRVLDLDMKRGTARVEPGVTFEALQARLAREGLAWHLPSFGGPPRASVLANALERGEGTGPMGDRFGQVWDLDVALATGERFSTGHSRHGAEQAAAIHARPAGPLVEGLFSQSGFGVALSGRIGLQPTMPYAVFLLAEIGPVEALPAALGALSRVIASGLAAPYATAIWNGAKRRAAIAGRSGLAPDAFDGMDDSHWAASMVVSAPHPELLKLHCELIASTLKPLTRSVRVEDDRGPDGSRQRSPLMGFSDGGNVMSAYAGKPRRPEAPGNPDLDGCGFLWLCPVVGFEGEAVARLASAVEEVVGDAPLNPALGFQACSSRALHGYVSFAWDREDASADAAAMRAHDALAARLTEMGMPPYRTTLPMTEIAVEAQDDWPAVAARLRGALDPKGLIAPGRVPSIDTRR